MTATPGRTSHLGGITRTAQVIVSCNGADCKNVGTTPEPAVLLPLDYRSTAQPSPNVKIGLPDFVRGVYHLPDRLLDLLEIAAYVYCADRHIRRGAKDAVEYHAWSRSLQFFMRVRDHAFWQQPVVCQKLDELLRFLAGNRQMKFVFQPGHFTSPTNLFDSEEFALDGASEKVVLYSGGVDSLAGIVDELHDSDTRLCLVSHRSGQPSIRKTQRQLLKALTARYPGRVRPYGFDCHLTGERAAEETQRTRFFLYTVIAFVLARSMGKQEITVFENGVTSLNLPKRQDMMHGRASRTTHPKTITLLRQFFSLVADADFSIVTPFAWKTKAEVMEVLRNGCASDLLSSSVSCSKTFKVGTHGTHCGCCSQCVDRRFASFASAMDDDDDCGLYSHDFLTQSVTDAEAKTTLLDYLRQAWDFAGYGLDQFYTARASDLSEIVDYLDGMSEDEAVESVWSLTKRHGNQVIEAVRRMRQTLRAAGQVPPAGSALPMIDEEAHAKALQPMSEPSPRLPPVEVFFSYSHRDEKLRHKLANHLSLLEREGAITGWHDRRIGAGTEWKGQIDTHLESAQVIVLLVSDDFLASDYCYDVELKRAMERHEAGEALVIPVILRACDWHNASFGKLQALPTDGTPVTSRKWRNQDEAFDIVVRCIRQAIRSVGE